METAMAHTTVPPRHEGCDGSHDSSTTHGNCPLIQTSLDGRRSAVTGPSGQRQVLTDVMSAFLLDVKR